MTRRKWLILGDSLALPRPGLAFEETWPYLLQRAFPDWDWVNLARRYSTTDRLNTDGDGAGGDCLEFYAPEGVVLNLGICDCAPRLYRRHSPLQYAIFNFPGSVGRRVSDFVERTIGRQTRYAWVPQAKFRQNLQTYLERCARAGARVIALDIMPVAGEMLEKNPEITSQIAKYNAVYRELERAHAHLKVLSVFDGGADMRPYTLDGYHPNAAGCARIRDAIRAELGAGN